MDVVTFEHLLRVLQRMRWSFFAYAIVNMMGILLIWGFADYLVNEAKIEERDNDGVDGITFVCRAAPVFLFCCLCSLIWCIKVVRDIFLWRNYSALLGLATAAAAWAAFYVFMWGGAR